MPEEAEQNLRAEVNKNHPDWSEDRKNSYIFGTLQKINAKEQSPKRDHWYFRHVGRGKSPQSDKDH